MGSIDDSVNMNLTDGQIISWTVNKYGDLNYESVECDNIGDEFNPLEDPDHPSADDPVRGTIHDVTAALTSNEQTFTQSVFL